MVLRFNFCGFYNNDDDQQYTSETSDTYNVLKERTVLPPDLHAQICTV